MQLSLFSEENLPKNDYGEYHICPICNEEKHEDEFYRVKMQKGTKLKVSEGCRPCYNEKGRLKEQLRKTAPPPPENCECCGRNFKEHNLNIELDHCHTTKKFNGWICSHCNGGLGRFNDDIGELQKAIEYRKRVNERNGFPEEANPIKKEDQLQKRRE